MRVMSANPGSFQSQGSLGPSRTQVGISVATGFVCTGWEQGKGSCQRMKNAERGREQEGLARGKRSPQPATALPDVSLLKATLVTKKWLPVFRGTLGAQAKRSQSSLPCLE